MMVVGSKPDGPLLDLNLCIVSIEFYQFMPFILCVIIFFQYFDLFSFCFFSLIIFSFFFC